MGGAEEAVRTMVEVVLEQVESGDLGDRGKIAEALTVNAERVDAAVVQKIRTQNPNAVVEARGVGGIWALKEAARLEISGDPGVDAVLKERAEAFLGEPSVDWTKVAVLKTSRPDILGVIKDAAEAKRVIGFLVGAFTLDELLEKLPGEGKKEEPKPGPAAEAKPEEPKAEDERSERQKADKYGNVAYGVLRQRLQTGKNDGGEDLTFDEANWMRESARLRTEEAGELEVFDVAPSILTSRLKASADRQNYQQVVEEAAVSVEQHAQATNKYGENDYLRGAAGDAVRATRFLAEAELAGRRLTPTERQTRGVHWDPRLPWTQLIDHETDEQKEERLARERMEHERQLAELQAKGWDLETFNQARGQMSAEEREFLDRGTADQLLDLSGRLLAQLDEDEVRAKRAATVMEYILTKLPKDLSREGAHETLTFVTDRLKLWKFGSAFDAFQDNTNEDNIEALIKLSKSESIFSGSEGARRFDRLSTVTRPYRLRLEDSANYSEYLAAGTPEGIKKAFDAVGRELGLVDAKGEVRSLEVATVLRMMKVRGREAFLCGRRREMGGEERRLFRVKGDGWNTFAGMMNYGEYMAARGFIGNGDRKFYNLLVPDYDSLHYKERGKRMILDKLKRERKKWDDAADFPRAFQGMSGGEQKFFRGIFADDLGEVVPTDEKGRRGPESEAWGLVSYDNWLTVVKNGVLTKKAVTEWQAAPSLKTYGKVHGGYTHAFTRFKNVVMTVSGGEDEIYPIFREEILTRMFIETVKRARTDYRETKKEEMPDAELRNGLRDFVFTAEQVSDSEKAFRQVLMTEAGLGSVRGTVKAVAGMGLDIIGLITSEAGVKAGGRRR